MGDVVTDLLNQFRAQQQAANAANQQRYQQGLDIYDRIIERNKEGGTFLAATEAQLKSASTRSTASGMQNLVSSGMAGTTQAAGLQKKFEAEVGQPTRLQAQDIAAQRLSEAEIGKASFIERREDVGPSFSDIANLATSIGRGQQAQQQQRSTRPTTSYTSVKQPRWSQRARTSIDRSRTSGGGSSRGTSKISSFSRSSGVRSGGSTVAFGSR